MGIGSHTMDGISLAAHRPPLEQYELVSSGPNYYLWHNSVLRNSLIEFVFNINNDQLLKDHIQSYIWRHRHYLFVSTLYFKQSEDADRYSIFYQRVFTNLSRIKDLCFQDSLQFYYTAFKGFQLLFQRFGYFEVQQEMFHVTLDSKIKIWCDRNISRIYPAIVGQGSQETMIRRIINIIESNSDLTNVPIHIGSIMSKYGARTFDQAVQKLRSVCKQNNVFVGDKLRCLQTIYRGGVQKFVDQFRNTQEQQTQCFSANPVPQNHATSGSKEKEQIKGSIPLTNIAKIIKYTPNVTNFTSGNTIKTVILPPTTATYPPHNLKQPQIKLSNYQNKYIVNRPSYINHQVIQNRSQSPIPPINIVRNKSMQHQNRILSPMPKINTSIHKRIYPTQKQQINFTFQRPIPINSYTQQQHLQIRSRSAQSNAPVVRTFHQLNNHNSFKYFPNPQRSTNSPISTEDGNKSLNKQQNIKNVFKIKDIPQNGYSRLQNKIPTINEYKISQTIQFKPNNYIKTTPIQQLQSKQESRLSQKMDTSLEIMIADHPKSYHQDHKQSETLSSNPNPQPLNLINLNKKDKETPLIFSSERLNQIIFSFNPEYNCADQQTKNQSKQQYIFQNVFEKSQKTTTTNQSSKFLQNNFAIQSKNYLSLIPQYKAQAKNANKLVSIKKYQPSIDQDIWNDLLKMRASSTKGKTQ